MSATHILVIFDEALTNYANGFPNECPSNYVVDGWTSKRELKMKSLNWNRRAKIIDLLKKMDH